MKYPIRRLPEAADAPTRIYRYQDYSLVIRKDFIMMSNSNLIYVTSPQSVRYEQINLFDLLAGKVKVKVIPNTLTGTRTIKTPNPSKYYEQGFIDTVGAELLLYTVRWASLKDADRNSLYEQFFIPKKTGGLRKINAPLPDMSTALIDLREILARALPWNYHTSAYAYVSGRKTLDAVKRHQANNSKWFLKLDMKDFFGNTTKEFVMSMFNLIAPFNLICETPTYKEVLEDALDLAFLNGGLPQGSPLSPMLTNIIMIPFDYELNRALEDVGAYTYTRYADDLVISCQHEFDYKKIIQVVKDVLAKLNAPYSLKEEKTKYGSSAGSNWILGLMLNRDGGITVGHKNKKRFRAMCNSFLTDESKFDLEELQYLNGLLSYYHGIEPDYFDELIGKLNEKHGVNFEAKLEDAMKLARGW